MPGQQIRDARQAHERISDRLVARTDLTDLGTSSVVNRQNLALARELDAAHFEGFQLAKIFDIFAAEGEDLDQRAREIQPGTLRRRGARRAIGRYVFSRATNDGTTIEIPAGRVVLVRNGPAFITQSSTTITGTSDEQGASGHGTGRDSEPVTILAVEPGEAGNVDADTILAMQDKPPGVSEGFNVTRTSFGRDKESDAEFRTRIVQFVVALSKGTPTALEFVSVGVEDPVTNKEVVFSRIWSDPINRGNSILYIDDGAGTAADRDNNLGDPYELVAAADGGEEYVLLPTINDGPVDLANTLIVRSTGGTLERGELVLGEDFRVNPTYNVLGQPFLYFSPPLTTGERIEVEWVWFTGLVRETQKVLDGLPLDRLNFPGWVSTGTIVRVLPATPVPWTVEGVYDLDGGDRATVIADGQNQILRYGNGLGIGPYKVIVAEVIERLMGVEHAHDITLTSPSANIPIGVGQVSQITDDDVLLS